MLLVIIFYTLSVFTTVKSRGPHHPRGEPIVKHHVHYRPTKGSGEQQNIIQDKELLHDKEHIQEHLDNVIEEPDLSTLTDEELEFYYFQVHDVDKNSKLDGLEILQAIQHTSHRGEEEHVDNNDDSNVGVTETDDFNYYVDLIDKVFEEDDVDQDGFLSYPEYVAGRKKETMNIQPSIQMIK